MKRPARAGSDVVAPGPLPVAFLDLEGLHYPVFPNYVQVLQCALSEHRCIGYKPMEETPPFLGRLANLLSLPRVSQLLVVLPSGTSAPLWDALLHMPTKRRRVALGVPVEDSPIDTICQPSWLPRFLVDLVLLRCGKQMTSICRRML